MSAGAPRSTPEPVRPGSGAMFDRIAGRYDLLNRVLSLGLDQSWRRRAIRALALQPGARVLDLATGTADLALMAATLEPEVNVVGLDPSCAMLARGREKVAEAGLEARVRLEEGAAESLPFPDAHFDGVMIAFGIRNVPDRAAGLAEMARVTKPGARIALLELNEPREGLLAPFARLWVRGIVPRVGAWLSGEPEYRYLQSSMAAFPPPLEFERLMRASGVEPLFRRALGFGACTLFVGTPAGGAAR